MPIAEGASDFREIRPETDVELGGGAHAVEGSIATAAESYELGEVLHGLNNVLVSIVLNAQIMEWKLPSYSLLRRNTHEIQRSAQRAGVLLKRLSTRKEEKDTLLGDAVES